MNLFSIFRSSSVEVLLSKRLLVILYGFMAISVLSCMAVAYSQFLYGYYSLHQFDTSIGSFIFLGLCLLMPFWAVGALMLRAFIQRVRLEVWVHKAAKVVTYSTPLKPAEAGFLVDYEYTYRELTATLLDLHFRQIINIDIDSSIKITILQNGALNANLSPYEQTLLNALSNAETHSFMAFTDPRLVALAQPAHEVLINDLTIRQMIQPEQLPRPAIRKFFRVVYSVAGFVGVILTYGLIFQRALTFSISYPRYSVNISELVTLAIIACLIVGIVISSCWPRFVQDYRNPQYEAWIDAAGFMLYVRTVYIDRFSADNIATQDRSTLQMYVPYAVAYGIIPAHMKRVHQILASTT
jgi:hypothetical protein